MKTILKFAAFSCLLILGTISIPHARQALADDDWTLFVSDTQLFSTLLPGNPEEHIETFRISNDHVIHKTEVVSFVDQRPYKDVIKNYVIKHEQSFGPFIAHENRVQMIEKEFQLHEKSYSDKKPKVIERSITGDKYQTRGIITLVYDEDIETETQAVRLVLTITNSSKFYQIFTGPEKDLSTILLQQYFDSLNIENGVIKNTGSMNEEWRRIESPFALFAVKIPSVTPPYFPSEPSVSKEKNRERIGMIFTDPIWNQNIFYSITGYQLDKEMSFELVKEALLEKHLKRHGRSEVGVSFNKDFIGETPYIDTHYTINPPKNYPYLNMVRIRALFLGNYMVVQEVVGPRHLVETQFVDGFFNLIEFTPKKAFQKELKRHLDASGLN